MCFLPRLVVLFMLFDRVFYDLLSAGGAALPLALLQRLPCPCSRLHNPSQRQTYGHGRTRAADALMALHLQAVLRPTLQLSRATTVAEA